MAVHGALLASSAGGTAPRGLLASIRNVDLYVERLDEIKGDLLTSVERITGDTRMVLYEFALSSSEHMLLNGRATVVFDT
jgi:predicted hotdog family 3-hydroxylacyl-ACP dehydratase